MSIVKKLGIFVVLVGVLVGAWWIMDSRSQEEQVELTLIETVDNTVKEVSVEDFTVEVLAESLTKPWDVVVLPDQTVLFSEDDGQISKVSENGVELVLDIPLVNANGEGGLMGLAADNEFEDSSFVYACYATNSDIRVSRWEWTGEELTNQEDIVTDIPVNRSTFDGRHSGCRPRFGPDNYLWIGTGDVAIGSNPQDRSSLAGKLLRVDRDGNAAPGNPSSEGDNRVYSYGHRNIQGIAFTDDGEPFVGVTTEHGPDVDDEINEIMRGANFGWNPVPGYNERVPMTDKDEFPNAVEALWSSGSPTLAPSGATFMYGEQWGQYDGALLVAMLKTQHIRVFSFDENGNIEGQEEWYKGEYGRIRSVYQSDDGALYVTTDNGDATDVLLKITP